MGSDDLAADIKIRRKKAKVIRDECVACGACVDVCPAGAVIVEKGVWAEVDPNVCVGCSKCAATCPASTITMGEFQ